MRDDEIRQRCDELGVLARQVRVLGSLSWDDHTVHDFLESHRNGNPILPEPRPVASELSAVRAGLDELQRGLDTADPMGAFVAKTARSYERAAAMLDAAGKPEFARLSSELYHHPRDRVVGTELTHVELARQILALTDELRSSIAGEESLVCLTAEAVRDALAARINNVFPEGSLSIVVDPTLASKAAASGTRVRIRGGASFSAADVDQLTEHEIFVHSATQQNGKAQPFLTALSLGAPRTTATQEGLATFAELMTGSMDLSRLRRIALRVEAVDRALSGADFIEIFQFFLEQGQSEDESVRSALRVFRGGDVRGRVAFTKDCVYLPGLVAVHTFVRSAIAEGQPRLPLRLFAGRLTIGDAIALGPEFESGRIVPGAIRPSWISDPRRVAASLAFQVAVNGLRLGRRTLRELAAAGE